MSEAARKHYSAIAREHGIELPPLLLGAPKQIYGANESEIIPIHRPQKHFTAIEGAYSQAVRGIEGFVLGTYQAQKPDVTVGKTSPQLGSNIVQTRNLVRRWIFPGSSLKTGHLYDVQVEAIAPDEVDPRIVRRTLSRDYVRTPASGQAEVFLRTSAAIYAGELAGFTACLTIVAPSAWCRQSVGITYGPRRMNAPYAENEVLGDRALERSRARATDVFITPTGALQTHDVHRRRP